MDVFEPDYSPKKVEFWLEHFVELATMAESKGSSAHIAEHLAREYFMLQGRRAVCLCHELHAVDSMAVDPACTHSPSGGGSFRAGPETALCITSDLRHAGAQQPANWMATLKVWQQQLVPDWEIARRRAEWRRKAKAGEIATEPEPIYARGVVIRRMARLLGWQDQHAAG